MKRCISCGRASCRCGEPVRNRACSSHGATLAIVSIAAVGSKGTIWYEVAKCTVPGCKTVRNFDKNRKTPKEDRFAIRLQKKFKGKIVAGFYRDEEQDCRQSTSRGMESREKVQKCRSCGSNFTGDFCENCGEEIS